MPKREPKIAGVGVGVTLVARSGKATVRTVSTR